MAGSVADGAGAKAGDYLIVLNGKDVQFATGDEVSSTLKYSYGSALEIRVARPHPLPVTDLDRRRAILTLQTKVCVCVCMCVHVCVCVCVYMCTRVCVWFDHKICMRCLIFLFPLPPSASYR